jgi:alpha-L-fucosidase 2
LCDRHHPLHRRRAGRPAHHLHPRDVRKLPRPGHRPPPHRRPSRLDTQQHYGHTTVSANEIAVTGRAPIHISGPVVNAAIEWAPGKGTSLEAILHVTAKGGHIASGEGNTLSVTNADEAILIISAATSFNGFDHDPATQGKDPGVIARSYLTKAVPRSYQSLLDEHLADYRGLFRRLWVSVNGESPDKNAFAYQYARYELIAASRPGGGAPRNEQGIWNHDLAPHYSSNFTLNENPEKFYVTAEPANIGETVEPLIDFVNNLAVNDAITANVDYGTHDADRGCSSNYQGLLRDSQVCRITLCN